MPRRRCRGDGIYEPGYESDKDKPGTPIKASPEALALQDGVHDGAFWYPLSDFLKHFAGLQAVPYGESVAQR